MLAHNRNMQITTLPDPADLLWVFEADGGLCPALRAPHAERHRAENEQDTEEHAAGRVIDLREDDRGAPEGGDGGDGESGDKTGDRGFHLVAPGVSSRVSKALLFRPASESTLHHKVDTGNPSGGGCQRGSVDPRAARAARGAGPRDGDPPVGSRGPAHRFCCPDVEARR